MRTLRRSGESLAAELAAARANAIEAVNAAARTVRLRFVTDIPGQEMIYSEKRSEAAAFVSITPSPIDLTPYPFIAAEVGITAPSAYEVAQLYLNLAAQWIEAGSALEAIRLGAVQSIETATTQSQIDAALALMASQLEALA
ncbi:MAG: hypothetical protein AAF230_00250 [Pseudomonadota bacterium]